MTRLAGLVLLGAILAADRTLAEKSFSGEDAAYIDWSVKNCGATSTDKEHSLVEQTNAKGRDAFSHQYLRQYESKNLADALASPSKQETMCTAIKAWYGPQGSRIADLIKWESDTSSVTSDKPAAAAAANRKGRRRSNP